MKSVNWFISILVIIACSSCSSVYRTAQTPDDIYYTPATTASIKKEVARNDNFGRDNYQSIINKDDKYLRMKAANRNRWEAIDDYSYWNDSRYDYATSSPYLSLSYGSPFYGYGGYGGYNNYYNGYYGSSYYSYPQYSNYWGYNNYNSYGYGYGCYGWNNPVYYIAAYQNGYYDTKYTNGSNVSAYKNTQNNNSNYIAPNNTKITRYNTTQSPNNADQTKTTVIERPARYYTPSSSNSGGRSGGYNSAGSSSSHPRSGRN